MAATGNRPPRESRRDPEPGSTPTFVPQTTKARWEQEAKIMLGPCDSVPSPSAQRGRFDDKVLRLQGAVQAVLVPPAITADKVEKEAEKVRQQEETERLEQLEQERLAREAEQAEAKAAKDKQEAEEREAAERAAEVAAQLAATSAASDTTGTNDEPEAMDGVETGSVADTADTDQPTETGQAAAQRPRVTTIIRGSPYDITDLGIDPEFLSELPEEIREEVIMSTVAERRSQAAATGAQPSDIDQEFLNALPEDIREEIVQQERAERRRRDREEARRNAAQASGGALGPQDMDNADFLVTLAPALRQQVLMEQDEAILSTLPDDLQAQARALQRQHLLHHDVHHRPTASHGDVRVDLQQRPQRRPVVQMLDKPGVATLLRLMFVYQHDSLRNGLNQVLQNICQNKLNRGEIISTILNILQDGTVDMAAVERCYSQLSIRASLPKDQEPKTPQPLKRTLTGTPIVSSLQHVLTTDAKPLLVVQQCLYALVYLVETNQHVQSFFLTEHEVSGALKRNASKKHKFKDSKAHKFALNSVLALLDRESITESTSVMEPLSVLLEMITSPLQILERKQQKEAAEEAKRAEAAAAATANTSETANAAEANADVNMVDTGNAATTSADEISTTQPAETSQPQDAPIGEVAANTSEAAKEAEKKQKAFIPPLVPEHNLKLVINIFMSRECGGKVFLKTLNCIKNLSVIPGAKGIFGRELIAKAKTLGETVLQDLQSLQPQLEQAESGANIQDVALARFTPESADQRRLLRILLALDHLFEIKHDKNESNKPETSVMSTSDVEKQELLSSLYDHTTLNSVWDRLSGCLSTIRKKEQIMSVANILLPLIEALMVVCKNTTGKEIVRTGRESVTSPVSESRMEALFLSFTEEHRKILNDLVRHQPKLMSGSFKILVKNPKVLEFDNKRNYFTRNIHDRQQSSVASGGTLQLAVRRDQVFHDSFKALYFQTADQMKFGKLNIRFHGEEGVDAGGVTREWFQVLSRQMFDPGYALFIPVSSDRTTFHPNQLSSINEEHLLYFKFIGRIIGKALYEGRLLDCHFSRAVYKRILGKSVSVKDMESLDPDYYKSLVWMLENDITDIITETFSVDNDKFGVVETIDFIPNGREVAVTEENKHEYVRLMVEWRLTGSVKEQLDEFLRGKWLQYHQSARLILVPAGFHDIIPAPLISIFNENELELLISGLPEIDINDWKGNTEYHNYTASSPQIQWFWRAVRTFDKEERAKLLQFVTGTSKVPLNGFKELEGMNGFSKFNIHRDYGDKERLPSSHTCFNQLDLPEYETYEALRKGVLTAITQGSEYFGFA